MPHLLGWFLVLVLFLVVVFYFYKYVVRAFLYALRNNLKFPDKINYLYVFNEIFIKKGYDYAPPSTKYRAVVFDIGGNIGLYSSYLNNKYQNLDIHVFEPVPQLYDCIKHNLSNAKGLNKIYTNNIGLSDTNQKSSIYYFPWASGLSTIASDDISGDLEEKKRQTVIMKCQNSIIPGLCSVFIKGILSASFTNSREEQIILLRMSDYIDAHHINEIDVVKIDVEGHELNVLRGIEERHFEIIKSFIIEVENFRKNQRSEILRILESHEYSVSILNSEKPWNIIIAKKI